MMRLCPLIVVYSSVRIPMSMIRTIVELTVASHSISIWYGATPSFPLETHWKLAISKESNNTMLLMLEM